MVIMQNEGNMSLWNIITRYLFRIFFCEVMTSFSFVGGNFISKIVLVVVVVVVVGGGGAC